MLKPTTKQQQRMFELADFIGGLTAEQFDIGRWGNAGEPRCICGWFMHNHGFAQHDDWRTAAEMLGLSEEGARHLFHGDRPRGPQQAAAELRELAWSL